MMKDTNPDNIKWIYDNSCLFGSPLYEEIDKIEEALGFRLFLWQKHYMRYQTFRRYGETTAKILTELVTYRDDDPLDFKKKPNNLMEKYERERLLEIKKKLDDAGIRTRKVLTPEKSERSIDFFLLNNPIDGLSRAIADGLKKLGITITEENVAAWSKRITVVDPGGFELYHHKFYIYLNKEWEFTVLQYFESDTTGNLTFEYRISNEEPPEGVILHG